MKRDTWEQIGLTILVAILGVVAVWLHWFYASKIAGL